jgi:hypothetical protein
MYLFSTDATTGAEGTVTACAGGRPVSVTIRAIAAMAPTRTRARVPRLMRGGKGIRTSRSRPHACRPMTDWEDPGRQAERLMRYVLAAWAISVFSLGLAASASSQRAGGGAPRLRTFSFPPNFSVRHPYHNSEPLPFGLRQRCINRSPPVLDKKGGRWKPLIECESCENGS